VAGLRRLTEADRPRLRQFWIDHWGDEEMIVHGQVFRTDRLEGYVAGNWLGLITYYILDHECEVMSLNSLEEDKGIGGALLDRVVAEAKEKSCRRVFLSTTNDNLRALGFYQRRGFRITALHPGALDEVRKLKPALPRIGLNQIPLRDEIELELSLTA